MRLGISAYRELHNYYMTSISFSTLRSTDSKALFRSVSDDPSGFPAYMKIQIRDL